jgi:hypothetical protein
MWRQRKPQDDPPLTAYLQVVEHASFSPLVRGPGGLLFDELRANHFRLNASHFRLFCEIAIDGGEHSFADLAAWLFPEATEQEVRAALHNLWTTGLFITRADNERAKRSQASRAFACWSSASRQALVRIASALTSGCGAKRGQKPCSQMEGKQASKVPRLSLLILEFALLNLWYQISLRLRAWKRVVAPIRLAQHPRASMHAGAGLGTPPPAIVDHLLAAAWLACGIPMVSARCAPVALTLYRMLKRRGYRCFLLIGSPPAPLWPHMWVEMDNGYVLDPCMQQVEESRYLAASELETRDDLLRLGSQWECCTRLMTD